MFASTLPGISLRRGASPWTCSACLFQRRLSHATRTYARLRPTQGTPPRPRRKRRRILLAAAGGTLGATAIAFQDETRHAVIAAQRTGRVVGTLALCINDYRVTLKNKDDHNADEFAELLKACHQRCADRTLVALEKNGSIFIKLGQHLTSLNYLLPREWCDTFIPLQDKCPVSSFESIQEMVRKDTGMDVSDYFSSFEPVPIGAASLAQVHRAVVRDTGRQVAVKVQHPALDDWTPLDLALTRFTFATLKRFFPDYDLTWLAEEMEVSLPKELDFRLEGRNADRARAYFARIPSLPLIIPEVLWARRRVLVMEYQAGHRVDDLAYLDSHGIDRDEVSATLARVFNEMIFGPDAPLHCDPHGGNIAIRHNPAPHQRGGSAANFDVILYDHGLYRDIPMELRRSYAKLWLAVLDADEERMRRYAFDVAGVRAEQFPLFASAITGRDYRVVRKGVAATPPSDGEKKAIGDALGGELLVELVRMLGNVPRVILLILKTNDLTRSLDASLQTRRGPIRSFLILARYASRTVLEEQLELLRARGSSLLWPGNWAGVLKAWASHARVVVLLNAYEWWLEAKRRLLRLESWVMP